MRAPFEAKRVIVAACAAMAMVMGAMSVTSSVSTSDSGKGHISSIVNTETPKTSTKTVKPSTLPSKHTIEVRNFLQQQPTPLYNTPTAIKSNHAAGSDSFNQILATVNPALFVTQLVQVQQPVQAVTADGQPVPASDTTTGDNKDSSATTGSTGGSGTSDPTSKESNPPKDGTTPPSDSGQPQPQSLSAPQSTGSTTPQP